MASASTSQLSHGQISEAQLEGDFAIKSEAVTPKLGMCHVIRQWEGNFVDGGLDTSQWPLLLKNYDKLLVRSSHFTPIPTVSSFAIDCLERTPEADPFRRASVPSSETSQPTSNQA